MDTIVATNLILYNAIVVWIFSIIAMIAGIRILKTQKENKEALSFGWFWFIFGSNYLFNWGHDRLFLLFQRINLKLITLIL